MRRLMFAAAVAALPTAAGAAQECAQEAALLMEQLPSLELAPAAKREVDVLTQAARAFAELENAEACRKALAEARRVVETPPAVATPPAAQAAVPDTTSGPAEAPASAAAEPVPQRPVDEPAAPSLPAPAAVYFGVGESAVDAEAHKIIAPLVDAARASAAQVKLRGFTDATGSRELNLALSRKRVENVANQFTRGGVAADRIDMDWQGVDPALKASGSNRTAAQESRRVEIELVR